MEDRFIHEFIKTDQEMLDLYHYALAFVYPSSYEGFGLPILEAYKAECPVLLNYASCFRKSQKTQQFTSTWMKRELISKNSLKLSTI